MKERRRFKKTPVDEREVVFYAEHGGYFPNFEGLVRELTQRHDKVVSYITSAAADPILDAPPDGVRSFYMKDSLPLQMAFIDCKVFVMTLTDLNQFHLKRSAHPVHYVYVFHSLVSTHMMYRAGAFDHYDSVLCAGPHHVEEIRRREEQQGLAHKQLVEAGYFRLERIRDRYREFGERPSAAGRTTVLVAPSWGEDNIIESCGDRLVRMLLAHEYNVIVRPHPETRRKSPRLLDALEQEFQSADGFRLERSVATDDSLLEADVLVCDLSGVALEYALGTERPVLFLDVPYKVKNPEFGALGIEPFELRTRPEIGRLISLDALDSVPDEVAALIERKDEYRERIARLRQECVFEPGRSAEVGARHILGLLEGRTKDRGQRT